MNEQEAATPGQHKTSKLEKEIQEEGRVVVFVPFFHRKILN